MKYRKNESAYLYVEASITFVLLLLMMASILALVNISMAQAKIHHALTQTANEMAISSYDEKEYNKMSLQYVKDRVYYYLGDSIGSLSEGEAFVNHLIKETDIDAEQGIADFKLKVDAKLLKGESDDYSYFYDNSLVAVDEKRKELNNDYGFDIRITADYKIEYGFSILPLPKNFSLPVRQTVITRALQKGCGPIYEEKLE